MNMCVLNCKIGFCVMFENLFFLSPLLAVLWPVCFQAVSCLWMNMFVHTQDWILCDEWKFIPSFTSFTHLNCYVMIWCTLSRYVAFEWTCLCILKIEFCLNWTFFYLFPLAVLLTDAHLASKLAGFCVMNENLFLLLPTCCVVKWCTIMWSSALLCGQVTFDWTMSENLLWLCF